VLDVFAGSGVTGRVAIETGRHSILGDADPQFPAFLARHLAQMRDAVHDVPAHRLIDDGDWSEHPVFRQAIPPRAT
jgi:hypothetical protein